MTRDKEFLVNSSPKFYCSIYDTHLSYKKKNYTVNCSDMVVTLRNNDLDSTCINSTTLEFSIKNGTVNDSGMYHCKIKCDNNRIFVCAATYSFGSEFKLKFQMLMEINIPIYFHLAKPQNVENFTCISKDYQNLNCTWDPVPNKVKTSYTIMANFGLPIVTYVFFFFFWVLFISESDPCFHASWVIKQGQNQRAKFKMISVTSAPNWQDLWAKSTRDKNLWRCQPLYLSVLMLKQWGFSPNCPGMS